MVGLSGVKKPVMASIQVIGDSIYVICTEEEATKISTVVVPEAAIQAVEFYLKMREMMNLRGEKIIAIKYLREVFPISLLAAKAAFELAESRITTKSN